jgi:hypothetical protein
MRSLASPLAFFFALSLQAESPKPAPPQTLDNLKQFASAHFERRENLSCTQVDPPVNSKTITVEFLDPSMPHHGTATSIDTANLFQDVFAPSSGTGFEWDHWGTLRGKKMAVYRYSNQINGKTHAGLVFADENTGAISRITFRAEAQTAHLFCSAQSR